MRTAARGLLVMSVAMVLVTAAYGQSRIASGGIDDIYNSYAWSMAEFDGDIYVGTGRYVDTFHIMWEGIWSQVTPGELPPRLPDAPYAPFLQEFVTTTPTGIVVTDPAKYEEWKSISQAQIWRYSGGAWDMVYESPLVPSFLKTPEGTTPYLASATTGFRSMAAFTDKYNQPAVYAFTGGFNFAKPGFTYLLYRSLDGEAWTGLATPAAMGRETRATIVHNGKLYVGVGSGQIAPAVWCTDDPATPASWTKVLDFSTLVHPVNVGNAGIKSLGSFNGFLYAGTQNRDGFQVWASTTGSPAGNADWIPVVTDGAGDRYNANAQTMKAFKGYLYVGSVSLPFLSDYDDFKGFELIRIRPDNTWQLVVGDTTPVDAPPGAGFRWPISGKQAGFGNDLNFYCWSMEVYGGYLYLGTFDAGFVRRYLENYSGAIPPELQPLVMLFSMNPSLQQPAGADLWKTSNGSYWTAVTKTGFGNANNYGFRTLQAAPGRLYMGTSNPFNGCEIWTLPRVPLIVKSPNGGEEWAIGSSQVIRWGASNSDGYVKIELTRDDGETWETIAASTRNDFSHPWVVTGPASEECRVRISRPANPSVYDVSDWTFEIEEIP